MGYLHSLSKCPIKELEKLRIMIPILAIHRNPAIGRNISYIVTTFTGVNLGLLVRT